MFLIKRVFHGPEYSIILGLCVLVHLRWTSNDYDSWMFTRWSYNEHVTKLRWISQFHWDPIVISCAMQTGHDVVSSTLCTIQQFQSAGFTVNVHQTRICRHICSTWFGRRQFGFIVTTVTMNNAVTGWCLWNGVDSSVMQPTVSCIGSESPKPHPRANRWHTTKEDSPEDTRAHYWN